MARRTAPQPRNDPSHAGDRRRESAVALPTVRVGPIEGCELLRIVFDSITDGVFTVDRNLAITSFNRAAERITGFPASEAIGRRCFEVFRTDVCHRQCALRAALNNELPVNSARVHIITRDGVEKAMGVSATVLHADGEIVGAVEFLHDLRAFDDASQQRATTGIVTGSPAMNRILDLLPNIARSDCSVLILGPSGSGKELIAQAIHSLSPRRFGPYVKINCAALPATLLESELFGYVKGAFTDARTDKPGHFALARGGTLLLDEIGEMDVTLQVKLLRVLNDGEYQPLGSARTLHADARVIAASNADLKALIEQGRFRADLFFRINVVTVELPPLSDRPEEIPVLITHFIDKFSAATGKPIRGVSPEAMRLLTSYGYPGNVRELENAIEHAFVMCDGETIGAEHLPSHLGESTLRRGKQGDEALPGERQLVAAALARCRGNRGKAARELGMHRTTLWRKLKSYGFDV
jgi:PAS domain S-box-containing protein